MGLSAGQARLLTITSRKSDCEFTSMRLSHQKIALSRELADLSNEYQNSLNQSKLIYDYYGTGDTNTPLSYGLLMTPSALNDFMPTLVTDSLGRVTLNSKYAAAARAAGIPQEGLGSLPSETLRNNFIHELSGEGIISTDLATRIMSLPYNQGAGLGADTTVAISTEEVTLEKLATYLTNSVDFTTIGADFENIRRYSICAGDSKGMNSLTQDQLYKQESNFGTCQKTNNGKNLTFGDIISDYLNHKKSYYIYVEGMDNRNNVTGRGGIVDSIIGSNVWEQMFEEFEGLFGVDSTYTSMALDYARSQIEQLLTNPSVGKKEYDNIKIHPDNPSDSTSNPDGRNDFDNMSNHNVGKDLYDSTVRKHLSKNWLDDIGINVLLNYDPDGSHDNDSCISAGKINISAMLMAYLTYFTDFMNGVSATDAYGNQQYEVNNTLGTSSLVKENTKFTIRTGVDVSSDDLAQATFYDTLFNQICLNGWTENENVEDPDYLQKMLQSGMLYISKAKDDHYYYQGNYATDPYIKEITDETYIAQAEAKYNTEKAKLNSKEETIDLKMKNIDTEISSLTTEYDTIKNTLSKNIERSFKRYDA